MVCSSLSELELLPVLLMLIGGCEGWEGEDRMEAGSCEGCEGELWWDGDRENEECEGEERTPPEWEGEPRMAPTCEGCEGEARGVWN